MDYLCNKDAFWDSELTWHNNTWPELTKCFENTALTWIPCGYLLLAAPIYIAFLRSSKCSTNITYTPLYVFKQLSSIFMIFALVAELSKAAQEEIILNDEIVSYSSWISVMVLHIFILHLEHARNIFRFPVLFVFWFIGNGIHIIQLYSAVQRETHTSDPFHFSMLTIRSILCFVLLLLHCISSPRKGYRDEKSSPYTTASIPSLLLYFWMDPIIIKGYKNPIQEEDIYNLPPKNATANVMNKFSKIWEKEKKKCKSSRKRTKKREIVHTVDLCEIPLKTQSDIKDVANKEKETNDQFDFPRPSYIKALMKHFISEMAVSQVGLLGRVADESICPLLLGFFINFIRNHELTWHGYMYTAAILAMKGLSTLTTFHSYYAVSMLSLRLQSCTMGSVFRKSLTISSEARKESATGEIINLMSVDSTNMRIFADYCFWFLHCIIYFIVGICLTSTVVGVAVLPGVALIFSLLLMNVFILNKQRVYQEKIMSIKDERIKIMNEILNGIKVIKLYGWEPLFLKKISDIREKELKILFKCALIEAVFNFVWRGTLFWINYLILVTFVLSDDDHYLEANKAFVALSYIGLIRLAVNIMPIIAQDIVKARTSVQRFSKFMNAQDISVHNLHRDTSDHLPVRILNADFSWEKYGKATLKGIDLEIEAGKLVAIVGTVGAGKSSLLSAMLGEMHKIKGQANLNSSVAYVPQQAWIQNASVKCNILFGKPYDKQWYDTVLHSCCLEDDLKIMAAGDETEIGEKGINLSGGQKQRISLARAVYSQADIYLLDDPLSAVDSHVGRHIFDQVIGPNGCIQGKTCILVTHGIQWLPEVDQVFVMSNGQISESGTFDELLAQNGDFSKFLTQYFVQHSDLLEGENITDSDGGTVIKQDILQRLVSLTSDSDASDIKENVEIQRLLSVELSEECKSFAGSSTLNYHEIGLSHTSLHMVHLETEGFKTFDESTKKTDANRLTTDEEAAGGRVSITNYWYLWKGVGHGYTVIILLFLLGYHVTYNYGYYWIAQWNDDSSLSNFTAFPSNSTDRLDRNVHYIVFYTVIGVLQSVCVLIYSFVVFIRHVEVSRKLHANLLGSVMKAPMSFFDTTPIGRILNRFSQDIEIIDNEIFFDVTDVVEHFLKAVGILVTISTTIPWFLVVVIPLVFLVLIIQRLFVMNSCQARRIASNKRSPIFAHFNETLSGSSVIRAYRAQDRFTSDSDSKMDDCQKAVLADKGCNRWMLSRLDMVNYLVVGSVCIFAVLMRDDLTPGIIGLAVLYAFNISIELCLTVEQMGVMETHFVSVERIREYSIIKSEASWSKSEDNLSPPNSSLWPNTGQIEFIGYSTRYREGLDFVLKNINCTINGGEKIGIVGRTGAGKSSMVLSLFRLIEPVNGSIVVDGVDISQLGLHKLRHNITILPQDPVLFSGTLRMNLDPQEEKTDSEIWTALEPSHLKTFVLGLEPKLHYEVGEGGGNLSMGQRQLVCLARTLLRKTKILVLDEATAAVDMDTDDLIQKTIRREFSDSTVITIAHRLNTIMDYDRIMVLQNGEIAEYDSPSSLLSNVDSSFFSMAKDAGLV